MTPFRRRPAPTGATAVVESLRRAERLAPGDPGRDVAQRAAARLVHAQPALLDDPALADHRAQLRQWSRMVPLLLDDDEEASHAARDRPRIASLVDAVASIETHRDCALATIDAQLRDLETGDAAQRVVADRTGHLTTARRAAEMADAARDLTRLHREDDQRRGIDDWRLRFALVEGTTTAVIREMFTAVADARSLARHWWTARSAVVGNRYSDRRASGPYTPRQLAEQSAAAAAAIAAAVPAWSTSASRAAAALRAGTADQTAVEVDGRLSVTVVARPTPRGSLMVGHELGHAVHALVSSGRRPAGALVGETLGCWAALTTGRAALGTVGGDDRRAAALALGDMLVDELFVSAAVSEFEDEIYRLAADSAVTAETLDAAWLGAQRRLWGDGVEIPDHIAHGWARLPSILVAPGYAASYVWATLMALACDVPPGASFAAATAEGAIDADDWAVAATGDTRRWIATGVTRLEGELDRLAQLVATG